MNIFKALEKFDKKIQEEKKEQEKIRKQEQRARVRERTEGTHQTQLTYIIVGTFIALAVFFILVIPENESNIGIVKYLIIAFSYALFLGVITFVRDWMYYHRFYSSSTISRWRTEKKLFDKKLRYAAIRGGIVLLGTFIILFILYFFRGSIN